MKSEYLSHEIFPEIFRRFFMKPLVYNLGSPNMSVDRIDRDIYKSMEISLLDSFDDSADGFSKINNDPLLRNHNKALYKLRNIIRVLGLWQPKDSHLVLKFYPLLIVAIIGFPIILFFVSSVVKIKGYDILYKGEYSITSMLITILTLLTYWFGVQYFKDGHLYELISAMFAINENDLISPLPKIISNVEIRETLVKPRSVSLQDSGFRRQSGVAFLEPPKFHANIENIRLKSGSDPGFLINNSINSTLFDQLDDSTEIKRDDKDKLKPEVVSLYSEYLIFHLIFATIFSLIILICVGYFHSDSYSLGSRYTSPVLMFHRVFGLAIHLCVTLFFCFICHLHVLDIDRHCGFYKSEFRDFSHLLKLQTTSRESLTAFVDFMVEDYLRLSRLTRKTSKLFRRMISANLLLSLLQAVLSLFIVMQLGSSISTNQLWEIVWIGVLSAIYLFEAVWCMYAAARINHNYFNVLRLASEYFCRLKFSSSSMLLDPTIKTQLETQRLSCTQVDVVYLQNITWGLLNLVTHRPLGISLYGLVLNRNFFFTIASPITAFVLFVIQRHIQTSESE